MLAAVVFDFDGVLANSEPLHLAALRAAVATRGWDVPAGDYYAHFLGYNDEDALVAMGDRYGWPLDARGVEALVAVKAERMSPLLAAPDVLYPGVTACVRALARTVPLAIASGARRDEIEQVLDAHHLASLFQVIVASGETARSKPAPDPYATAVALLQQRGAVPKGDVAGRCVAIEDSRWGIQSAREAGLRCIGLTTSYPADELSDADLVLDSLDQATPERLAALVEDRA
jgi:beta-phosphoglucomutase